VGDAVPLSFWEEGKRRICAVKPDAILINEGSRGEYLLTAFDSMYCFDWHSSVYNVFTDELPATDMQETWEKVAEGLPEGAVVLRDIDNHDTVTDWPARTETAAGHEGMEQIEVMNFIMDGIPMVYCGNELGRSQTSRKASTDAVIYQSCSRRRACDAATCPFPRWSTDKQARC
jgi:glycosidase